MVNMEITLAGTLMWRNMELARFVIEDDNPIEFVPLREKGKYWPFYMTDECDGWALIDTLKDRVVPPTRQGLIPKLRAIGIDGYDISAILEYQNASAFGDRHWVRFDGRGPQTWEELLKKIGYTVVF